MQEVCERFHALHVDHTEYACLKAIILFRPGKGDGLEQGTPSTPAVRQSYTSGQVRVMV